MTPLEEIEAIQARCKEDVADDVASKKKEMDWCASQIARVGEMTADAKKALTWKKKEVTASIAIPSAYSATMFKALVETGVADEQYLVDRLEGLKRALGRRFDSTQSALSYDKVDRNSSGAQQG